MSRVCFIPLMVLLVLLSGCLVAPLKVAYEVEVTVIDAKTGNPIPNAQVIYLACDIHDFSCSGGRLVRTSSNENGEVSIDSKRQWGFWILAPGGWPVPNHLIAVWASGYSAFVFSQYGGNVTSRREEIRRLDVREALNGIPSDQSSSAHAINPPEELNGGKIKLLRTND